MKLLISVTVSIATLIIFSCLGLPTPTDEPTSDSKNLSFTGLIFYYDEYTHDSLKIRIPADNFLAWGMVHSSPRASNDSIKLNGARPETVGSSEDILNLFGQTILGRFIQPYTFGTQLKFEIFSNLGNCSGSITIPDKIVFSSHEDSSSVTKDNDLTLNWNNAGDFYNVSIVYQARDSNGYYISNVPDIDDSLGLEDNVLLTSSFKIPGKLLAYDGEIYIYVDAVNGPIPREGVSGNMSCDSDGFLYSMNNWDDSRNGTLYLRVGNYQGKILSKKIAHSDRKKRILERLFGHLENK